MVGQYLRRRDWLRDISGRALISFVMFFFLSIIGVYYNDGVNIYDRDFGPSPLLYYPLAFVGIGQLVAFSMLLNKLRFKIIEILSTGTIAIMGLHGIEGLYFATFVKRLFNVDIHAYMYLPIVYFSYSLIVMFISYPVIIMLSRWMPWAMGNRKFNLRYDRSETNHIF